MNNPSVNERLRLKWLKYTSWTGRVGKWQTCLLTGNWYGSDSQSYKGKFISLEHDETVTSFTCQKQMFSFKRYVYLISNCVCYENSPLFYFLLTTFFIICNKSTW